MFIGLIIQNIHKKHFYGYIRKIENQHIMFDLIKTSTQIGMEIKYRAFVLNDIHNAELLPELTEAYKNFKTLLEKT